MNNTMNWSKEKMRDYITSTTFVKTVLKTPDLTLDIQINTANNKVVYVITDGWEYIHHSFDNMRDAIDKFYEMREKYENK